METVKKEKYTLELAPEASTDCVLNIASQEYLDLVVDQYSMRIYALGKVKETKQQYAKQDDFRLRRPDLKMEAKVGELGKDASSISNQPRLKPFILLFFLG